MKKITPAKTAWILGVLLIIALGVIAYDRVTISDLQNPAKHSITAQEDAIRVDCSATDADSKLRCADDLQALSDLLAHFSKSLHPATPTNVTVQPAPVK